MNIEGTVFDKLIKSANISNQILSEYLGCDRTTIINRRKPGIHFFSKNQTGKLRSLFTVDYELNFEELLYRINIGDYILSSSQIDFIKESLKIHRLLREYEEFLVNQRIRTDLNHPEVNSLPTTRYRHISLINLLKRDSTTGVMLHQRIEASGEYFESSEKHLSGKMIKDAYLLSIDFIEKNRYNQNDANKVKKFDLVSVQLEYSNKTDIDDEYKHRKKFRLKTTRSSLFDTKPIYDINSINYLKQMDHITVNDFISELYKFSKNVNKEIIMFLNPKYHKNKQGKNIDEYDYLYNHASYPLRRKLKKIRIYKLNNMFGKANGRFLELDESLMLYNIAFNKELLDTNLRYRNIAINTILNKLMFKHGREDDLSKDYEANPIHLSFTQRPRDKMDLKKMKRIAGKGVKHE